MHHMTAALLYGQRDVRIEQVALPPLHHGEVLLQIMAALTCGTDLKVYRRGYHARMITPPAVFGHEFSGVVREMGAGVEHIHAGDRVVALNSAPCGKCFYCQKNQPSLCEDLLFLNGAYAEFVIIPARIVRQNLLPMPPHLSFRDAALTEPLACVVRGIEVLDLQPGDTLAVLGAGPIGLLFLLLAKHYGARVIMIGRRTERLDTARRLGADHVIDAASTEDVVAAVQDATDDQRGADCVVEAVGSSDSWTDALGMVRPGGVINLFGGCPDGTTIPLDARRMHYEEISIRPTFHHTPATTRRALELLGDGIMHADELIDRSATLQKLPAVLRAMHDRQAGIKTAILP